MVENGFGTMVTWIGLKVNTLSSSLVTGVLPGVGVVLVDAVGVIPVDGTPVLLSAYGVLPGVAVDVAGLFEAPVVGVGVGATEPSDEVEGVAVAEGVVMGDLAALDGVDGTAVKASLLLRLTLLSEDESSLPIVVVTVPG